MKLYYVHTVAQPNGDYEVHAEDCHKLPLPANRISLGNYASCHPAVAAAKKYHTKVNGCIHCCTPCHTS